MPEQDISSCDGLVAGSGHEWVTYSDSFAVVSHDQSSLQQFAMHISLLPIGKERLNGSKQGFTWVCGVEQGQVEALLPAVLQFAAQKGCLQPRFASQQARRQDLRRLRAV